EGPAPERQRDHQGRRPVSPGLPAGWRPQPRSAHHGETGVPPVAAGRETDVPHPAPVRARHALASCRQTGAYSGPVAAPTLPGYALPGDLGGDDRSVFSGPRRECDGSAVLVETTRRSAAPTAHVEALRVDQIIRSGLESPNIARVVELVRHDDRSWLVIEDRGG